MSSLSPITTALPLVFVLAVTAIKDGVDDRVRIDLTHSYMQKRHISDRMVNNRTCMCLRDGRSVADLFFSIQLTRRSCSNLSLIMQLQEDAVVGRADGGHYQAEL